MDGGRQECGRLPVAATIDKSRSPMPIEDIFPLDFPGRGTVSYGGAWNAAK